MSAPARCRRDARNAGRRWHRSGRWAELRRRTGSPALSGASVRSGESATRSDRKNPAMGARRRGLARERWTPRTGIARAWRIGLVVITSSPRSHGLTTYFRHLRACGMSRKLLALLTNDDLRPHSARPRAARHAAASSAVSRGWSRLRPCAIANYRLLLVRPDRQPDGRMDAVGGAAVAGPPARWLAAAAGPGPGAHVRAVHDPGAASAACSPTASTSAARCSS